MYPRLVRTDEPAIPPTAPNVREVIDLYLRHTRHEQEARTFEGRQRHLEAFARAHGGLLLDHAKPYHLRLWVDAQTQWRSDWTRKGAVRSVQGAFIWAVKLGVIDRNPFWGVSQREGEPGRAMTEAEYRAMLRASSAPFRRVLVFLRFSGCRPCELSAIGPEHVDFERGVVTLQKHKTARTQKNRKPRVIVLDAVNVKLVAYLMRTMIPGQTKLFINSRGRPWTRYALACRMKRLRKRLKLPEDCRMYGLRHKFGTDGIKNNIPGGIKTVAVLMGHTTTRSTERYVHIDDQLDFLREAVGQVVHTAQSPPPRHGGAVSRNGGGG